jgi:hypothetical protein
VPDGGSHGLPVRGDQVSRDVPGDLQPEVVHEWRLVGVVHLDGQVDQVRTFQQLHHPLDGRVVELHVPALQYPVSAGGQQPVCVLQGRHQGLLAEDVQPGGMRLQADTQVRRVRDGDDHGVQSERDRLLQ